MGPCETHYQSYLFHYLIFFIYNLFCCFNSEISILWYIINLIKLQILKHLQKRKMVLSLLLNVVILHVIFRCLWRQCQVLIYFCVLIVYLHIIEILSHLPFEWHFSYISQWKQWLHACVHVFMYHALLSVYKLACFWSDNFLFISNLIFCLSVQRGKKTGYGHKMWRTKIHEGNFFFWNIQVLHACKCRMF